VLQLGHILYAFVSYLGLPVYDQISKMRQLCLLHTQFPPAWEVTYAVVNFFSPKILGYYLYSWNSSEHKFSVWYLRRYCSPVDCRMTESMCRQNCVVWCYHHHYHHRWWCYYLCSQASAAAGPSQTSLAAALSHLQASTIHRLITQISRNITRSPPVARRDALQFLLQYWPSRSYKVKDFHVIWNGVCNFLY